MDAIKSNNTSENLAIKTANTLLVIERRHSIVEKDTIFLNLANTKIQQYRFRFTADQLDRQGLTGLLEDNYLHTSTLLNLSGSTLINFSIADIPGSYATDRFRIVFTPALVLPLSFTSIKAWQENKDVTVEWKVENEINIRQYETEKSGNGTQFTNLSATPATANGGRSASYQVTDAHPAAGYNYYRIKSIDLNGRTEYTGVVKVFIGKGKQEIIIYPNPVIDGAITIQLNNMPAGKYAVKLLNNLGQKLLDKIIQHAEGSSSELITVDKNMPHGIYQLEITEPNKEMITNKLLH
jgi:Secretion system C-terminal sorting domain